ncbi:hypothetical protein EV13_2008 [Prochlorococcus sp. MIT 0702]|nr:hypothetical protein EV13_2008 [Prochlorococcus sp. MIT 0702]KGG28168.1 hypothetical protein EV12_0917 [Prochlorococcus sp. MIT 0701]KGG37218.1 hypothetical protein EV14_0009 [Prochlorococcus sp. MIT 0703]
MNSCWRFGLSTADKGFFAEERLSKERLAKALPQATGVCLSIEAKLLCNYTERIIL